MVVASLVNNERRQTTSSTIANQRIIDNTALEITYLGVWTTTEDHLVNGRNTSYYGGSASTSATHGDSFALKFNGELTLARLQAARSSQNV